MERFMKKYWGKYGVTTMEEVDKLAEKNYCILNAKQTKNQEDILNGVLITIKRKDFETYKIREEIYDLYETPYCVIDPES